MTTLLRRWTADAARDMRFAVRSLLRTPGFSAVTILSLGIGLAVVTATLAVSNAYLLRSMPFPDAERLYHVMYAPVGPYEPSGMSALDWGSVSDVVDATVVAGGASYYVGDPGSVKYVRGLRVSPGFIDGLGLKPVIGTSFAPQDFMTGAPPAVLIGYDMWRDRFNSSTDIVGRMMRAVPEDLSEGPISMRVLGVLPQGFWFGRTSDTRPDFIIPMHEPARAYMVRLRPGIAVKLAEQRITTAARAVGSNFKPDWTGVHLESMHERYVAETRPFLYGISAAAVLVLLLVCANVAIMTLLRSLRRQAEIAVRVALGARSRHLLRLLGAEAAIVCAAALALALTLILAMLKTLAPIIEEHVGRPPPGGPSAIPLDGNVALMIGGVVLFVAVALTLTPFIASRGRALASTVRRGGLAATDGRAPQRMRSSLIALEVAGAVVLLAGGGVMIRSVLNLMETDMGIDAQHIVRTRLVLPATYDEVPKRARFYDALASRVAAASPLSAVSSSFPGYYPTNKRPVEVDSRQAGPGTNLSIGVLAVGAGYFAVFGTEIQNGREFARTDRLGSEPVAIVSETLAGQLWPDGSAIGRRLRTTENEDLAEEDASHAEWRRVVGVARDVRQGYDDDDLRDIYLPFLQTPTRYANIQTRTDRAPLTQASIIAMVRELDPLVRVEEPTRQADDDHTFARARFMTALLGGFAAFSTLIALLGIYGVTAYVVQQREREIAIRVAIGASGRSVVRLFLREALVVLGAGATLGWWATSASGRLLESQVHGVEAFDVGTLIPASLVLIACCLFATWLPARRAATTGDLLTKLKE